MWRTKFQTHTKKNIKITVLYILIFKFLDNKMEDKRLLLLLLMPIIRQHRKIRRARPIISREQQHTALTKPQFVVTHPIRQTEIPASPGSWVTNTPAVTTVVAAKQLPSLYFR
jgi:hypothetical protein